VQDRRVVEAEPNLPLPAVAGRRQPLGRVLLAILVAGALALAAAPAEARAHKHKHHHVTYRAPSVAELETSAKYAAFVGEPETGRILYEKRADAQRFPASLTKMMTLWELFGAIEKGQIKMSDTLRASAHASYQAPSKLGLEDGDTIRVEDAIKAIVVVSANDVAVTIAENLGGKEDAFCARMTAHARAMGMTNTQFVNASGLPDGGQLSTARDLYTLGTHLLTDFPQYYHYFAIESFRWNGRVFSTHNHLVGKVDGVDGIKTGYTAASGFNLVTSAKRDGKRLIAVVLGGATSRQRDEAMRRMLNTEFASLEKAGPMVAKADEDRDNAAPTPAAPIPAAMPPSPEALTASTVPEAVSAPARPYPRPKPGEELATQVGGGTIGASQPEPKPAALSPTASTSAPVTAQGDGGEPSTSTVATLIAPPAQAAIQTAAAEAMRWGIQIGAYVSETTATSKLAAARKTLPKLLGRATQSVERVAIDDTAYYRARFGPLDENEARHACALLEPHGFKCFAVQAPESELASGSVN
jgi:D-alanyl-D-alanine carboxypeptidase